jgi:hypothetical protein
VETGQKGREKENHWYHEIVKMDRVWRREGLLEKDREKGTPF